jgi:hypothetical protein
VAALSRAMIVFRLAVFFLSCCFFSSFSAFGGAKIVDAASDQLKTANK